MNIMQLNNASNNIHKITIISSLSAVNAHHDRDKNTAVGMSNRMVYFAADEIKKHCF